MRRPPSSLVLLLALAPASIAQAGGFYISDVGSRGMTRGGAFIAAPDSLLAMSYNPGALTLLGKGLHVEIDFQLVALDYKFQRTCPCVDPNLPDAAALDAALERRFGTPAENIDSPQPIPSLFLAYGFDWNKLTVGLGVWAITSPGRGKFGESEYAAVIRQPQRYSMVELDLFEAFFVGAVAIEPIQGLRFGLVVGAYEFNVQQSQVLWANTNLTAEPENSQLDIPTRLAFDAPLRMMWNAGISYTPTFLPQLSLGASVLGKRSARAPGTVDIEAPPLLVAAGGSITGNEVVVEVNLPPIFRFGVEWAQPGVFEAEAALVIEGWQVYDEVIIRPTNVVIDIGAGDPQPLDTIHFETRFRTTYAMRLGGELQIWEPYLGVRAGYFLEPGSTPDELLDVSSPDLTKHGFTLGLGTTWYGVHLEVGGVFVIMPEKTITASQRRMLGPLQPPEGDNTLLTTTGNGTYQGSYFIFGTSLGVQLGELMSAISGDDEAVAPVPEKGLASPSGES